MDTLTSLGFASQKEEIKSGLEEAAVGCVTITKVPLALTFYDPMNNPCGKLLVQLLFFKYLLGRHCSLHLVYSGE